MSTLIASLVHSFLLAEQEVAGWTSTLARVPGFVTTADGTPIPTALKAPDGTPIFRLEIRPDLVGTLMRSADCRKILGKFADKLGETLPNEAEFFAPAVTPETRQAWLFSIETCLAAALSGDPDVYAVPNRKDVSAGILPRLRVGLHRGSTFMAKVHSLMAADAN